MIAHCEQCQTAFELDPSRLGARGSRVRCSHCKHVFVVWRPGATPDDAIDEVVADATHPGASAAPPATLDASHDGGHATSAGELSSSFEEDWEFNEDPPAESSLGDSSPAIEPPSKAPERPAGPSGAAFEAPFAADGGVPKRSELEDLGRPEEWDLLGSQRPPSARVPPPTERSAGATETTGADPQEGEGAAAPQREATRGDAESGEAEDEGGLRSELRPVPHGRSPLLGLAAWTIASALWVGGLAGALRHDPAVGSPTRPSASVSLGDLRAEDVQGRLVENAHAGSLFVVSGRVQRASGSGPSQGLRVLLLQESGTPIPGAIVWASPAFGTSLLRELPPEELRRLQRAGISRLAAALEVPGRVAEFHAVFAGLPPDAADFRLATAPLPARLRGAGSPTESSLPAPDVGEGA